MILSPHQGFIPDPPRACGADPLGDINAFRWDRLARRGQAVVRGG